MVPFLLKGIAHDFTLMQNDGIHPTAKAQPIILNNVMEQMGELINR